jgi:hypothetical protein
VFTLVQTIGLSAAARREFVPFAVAFLIADLYFKFGSFALECVTFLATWYVLSLVFDVVMRRSRDGDR